MSLSYCLSLWNFRLHFTKSCRSYLAATSRQNLETIVEAIRHLEGDHLFNDDLSGSRKGQLVEVEIDTEGEPIGCSLVVTSSQDEVAHNIYCEISI